MKNGAKNLSVLDKTARFEAFAVSLKLDVSVESCSVRHRKENRAVPF